MANREPYMIAGALVTGFSVYLVTQLATIGAVNSTLLLLAIVVAFVFSYNIRHRTLFDIPEPYLYALPYTLITFLIALRWSGAYRATRA